MARIGRTEGYDEDDPPESDDSPKAAHRAFRETCQDYAGFEAEDYGPNNPPLPALGSGKRFKSLSSKLAKRPGVTDPKALAASIGRKKYGARKMSELAAKGRRRSMKDY